MDKYIAECSQTTKVFKELAFNNLVLMQNVKDIRITLGSFIPSVGNNVVANIESTFNSQVEIAFCGTMNELIFCKMAAIVFLDSFKNIEVVTQSFEPSCQHIFIDQGYAP